MIKKLERKLTIVLMTIFSLLLSGVLITINFINYKKSMEKVNFYMEKILDDDEDTHSEYKQRNTHLLYKSNITDEEDIIFRLSQFYIVNADMDGNIVSVISNNSSGYTNSTIEEFASTIFLENDDSGRVGHLLYTLKVTNDEKTLVFIDNTLIDENINNLLKYSILFGTLGLLFLLLISIVLSKWISSPVKESFQKQKQFISDASHELKTPLTVISANADVLENEIGNNKWLKYIQDEVLLMSSLVNKLLILAKVETITEKNTFCKFNLSKAILGASMPFESIAFEKNVTLDYKINDNLFISGDEHELKQVVAILLDNALKHTHSGNHIIVSLKKIRNKLILKVSNDGEQLSLIDKDKIFERFYRADQARSRNDKRYGLGLAIAKAIIDCHKGSIKAQCSNGWTEFIIIL